MQTSLEDFQAFIVRKLGTPETMDSLTSKGIDGGEDSAECGLEKSKKRKPDLQSPYFRRNNAGESSDESRAKRSKMSKSRATKADDKSVSKSEGKYKERDDDIVEEAPINNHEGRTSGRTRKPRIHPGMVSWKSIIESRSGASAITKTEKYDETAMSTSVSRGQSCDDELKVPYPDPNLQTRAEPTRRKLPGATEPFQDLHSRLASRRFPKTIDASGSSPQVFHSAMRERSEEELPHIDDLVASKTLEQSVAKNVLDQMKDKEIERKANNRTPSLKSETIESKTKDELGQDRVAGTDDAVFHSSNALPSNNTIHINIPPAASNPLPTPTGTIRATSITPPSCPIKIRFWIVTNLTYYQQIRWREGTVRRKTLDSVVDAIAKRVGIVNATIKGLECVLRTAGKEFSDSIEREDEAGFAEMKEHFNEEVERILRDQGESEEKVFDVFLEPLKEFEYMNNNYLDNDGEGWI